MVQLIREIPSAYDGLNGKRANRKSFKHFMMAIHLLEDIWSSRYKCFTMNFPIQIISSILWGVNLHSKLLYWCWANKYWHWWNFKSCRYITTKLPQKVFAIALTPDTFRLSTREEYARAGIFEHLLMRVRVMHMSWNLQIS